MRVCTCAGVQAVGVRSLFIQPHPYSQWTGYVGTVTVSALSIVNPAHVHDASIDTPSEQPIGQVRQEAPVGGQYVRGEDVGVARVRGHTWWQLASEDPGGQQDSMKLTSKRQELPFQPQHY